MNSSTRSASTPIHIFYRLALGALPETYPIDPEAHSCWAQQSRRRPLECSRRFAKKEGNEEDIIEDASVGVTHDEARLEQLYEEIAWPPGKKYGHPYDAFKLASSSKDVTRLAPAVSCCNSFPSLAL